MGSFLVYLVFCGVVSVVKGAKQRFEELRSVGIFDDACSEDYYDHKTEYGTGFDIRK